MNNENNNEINSQPISKQNYNKQINDQSYNQQPMNNQQGNPAMQGFQQPVQQPTYNQPINNQNYNQQPMNNQPIDNQNYNQQPMNNQPIDNQNYNQQPMNNQPINGQNYNQQPMNKQPINNQPIKSQNYNGNFTQTTNKKNNKMLFIIIGVATLIVIAIVVLILVTTNKKNNKMLFIIIGVATLIVIAIVVLILVLSGNNSKGNIINDFEHGGDVNNEVEDTIAFQGFTLKKQSGYQYGVDATGLTIKNNSFATMVSVVPGDLATLKSAKSDLVREYSNSGYNPTNAKIEKYGNKEVMTIELVVQGQKALFYLMDADNNYSFLGVVMNSYYTINYDNINTTISLLSSAKFTGDYKAPTNKLNAIEYKDLFE